MKICLKVFLIIQVGAGQIETHLPGEVDKKRTQGREHVTKDNTAQKGTLSTVSRKHLKTHLRGQGDALLKKDPNSAVRN